MKKVLVIVGPTATGKSALAVKLAKKFNGEIISADSRQVYKGLNIGTGKITKKEMGGIPHHLLDVEDPKKQFTVSDFRKKAAQALDMIYHIKSLPIVVGGTGFYIDALTGKANFPDVPPNKELRAKLEKKSITELFKILKKKDPKRALTIDALNKVRLVRALEIIDAIGKVPALANSSKLSAYSFLYIGLKPDDIDKKINKRLSERLEGMIREGNKLHREGLSYKRMHDLGLEYRYIAMYLQKRISKKETEKQLNIVIRQYAKRQMTWFKLNKEIKWFDPGEYKKIEKYVDKNLGGR